jgi:predicted nucleic acid-binding protein
LSGVLLDTNVLSELRKRDRANANVLHWFSTLAEADVFLSVLVLGEIRRGIEAVRGRDPAAAMALDRWLAKVVAVHGDRILEVDTAIAEEWGRLDSTGKIPVVDGLLAATARVHEMVLATRNVKDVARTGVRYINPFEPVST